MTRTLTVQNAQITTATVEIQTLTVGGKQVTLAVFRQLKREPLVNDDGTLNGTPWGIVNYHPDKCADGDPHIHVVWQRGSELRRSACRKPVTLWPIQPPSAEKWLDAALLDGWRPSAENRPSNGKDCIEVQVAAGARAFIPMDPVARSAIYGSDWALSKIRDRAVGTVEDLTNTVVGEIHAGEARANALRSAWADLCNLPQLFIAV